MLDSASPLTAFQIEVALLFFGLPASEGFLLAGGAWLERRFRSGSETFCRLLVHGSEDLVVDLALDSAPGRPASATFVGPTFASDELAGRKVVALFDRAAARDFVDVYALSRTFAKTDLLELAREVDAGVPSPCSSTWSATWLATVTST